jgi:hypothetical protein
MSLKETDWEGVEWTYLAQDRDKLRAVLSTVINTVMNCTRGLFKQQPLCERAVVGEAEKCQLTRRDRR